MQVEYATVYLEQLCTDQRRAQAELGQHCARKLYTYLDSLKDAPSMEDVPPLGHLHVLTGDRAGQMAFKLDKKMRLVFSVRLPETGVCGLKEREKLVTIICVEYIGNYHD
ncbi:hypothetical protein [Parasutterella muris]|uniref:Killer suppression protein HigA n=1 Tax=Parasutterella muris TaxID=2565572 RepID=A0A6L6YFQ1_9BURK|nr:hypothetical protein [Parasutterella muris]MVX55623.1 hypothetical protein [Parasutterella muris]